MKKTNYLELKHFSNEHMDILNSFELSKEQVQFTSLPGNYKEVTEGQYRIVILCDGEPVGFFLLHSTERVKDYSDNPQAMLLTSLSINQAKQGQGYAKQAMLLLRKFAADEFPDCNEIVLAVNHKNIAAQKLYEKVGFQDTGRRKMGPIGEQYIMNLIFAE
ncbi:GNAT family N-acetyltransferase [Cytobacillus oceanisediminis]|uniref:GNAT family N-acetyltransferase n=1 Tax=Cytobacillus oceanisediminis TaxID=665099 RepID=UPI0023D9F607|nr:GNAT family N-acetyltransferase [Cytobacillus oceanisediminis]MDF2038431.1 GNAT family N-acetyltransferase [Cytobacillus oceanisediminis]